MSSKPEWAGQAFPATELLPAFTMFGFYPGRANSGDGLTRGCGGPENLSTPHRLRWCPQCKALFEWAIPGRAARRGSPADVAPPIPGTWTYRDCPVCQHRSGVASMYGHCIEYLSRICKLKPVPGHPESVVAIPWPEVVCELLGAELSSERFLAAAVEDLQDFCRHLLNQLRAQHGLPALPKKVQPIAAPPAEEAA